MQDIWIFLKQSKVRHKGIVLFYMYEVQIKWHKTVLWVQMCDLGWEPIVGYHEIMMYIRWI